MKLPTIQYTQSMKKIKTNRNKSITITEGDVDSDSGDYIVYVPERKNKNLFEIQQSSAKAREVLSRRSIS